MNIISVLSLKLTFTLSGMELLKSLQSGSEAVPPRHMAQALPEPTKDVFLQDMVISGHPDSTHQLRALREGPWSAQRGETERREWVRGAGVGLSKAQLFAQGVKPDLQCREESISM